MSTADSSGLCRALHSCDGSISNQLTREDALDGQGLGGCPTPIETISQLERAGGLR